MYVHDTIVAPATAPGQGAVAIIRLSGPEAFRILKTLWRPARRTGILEPRKLRVGRAIDPDSGAVLDRAMAVERLDLPVEPADLVPDRQGGSAVSQLVGLCVVLVDGEQRLPAAHQAGTLPGQGRRAITAVTAGTAPPASVSSRTLSSIAAIHRHLRSLVDVGLGYVRLGQPAPTLSGGEAQRVKLASELQKRSTGKTVYVLDEPTTGLHFQDIQKLLGVINGLVEKGNTVIVIEHNLDVIKTSDWVIDLGPEGGSGGGLVIAEGTPEEVADIDASYTGKFLRQVLAGEPRRQPTRPRVAGAVAAAGCAAAARSVARKSR